MSSYFGRRGRQFWQCFMKGCRDEVGAGEEKEKGKEREE
jgi:hypothetical protein